jgi:uncharacterized protein (TIRG00374 family)
MKQWLAYFLGWVLGAVFIYLAFAGQNFEEIFEHIQSADYRWPILIVVMSLGVHFVRAWRWKILIDPLGFQASVWTCFLGLMVGYLVNLGIPRLGELTRCAVVQKRTKASFAELLGTVISERAVDVACLLLAFLLAVALQWQKVASLTMMFADVFLQKVYQSVPLLFAAIALFGLLVFFLHKIKFLQKITSKFSSLGKGLLSITTLKNPLLFLGLTLATWLAYFLMTYLWFFSFKESESLSPLAGLVFMTFGSLGRSLPIQGGGVGAYHFVFTQIALLYGVSESVGLAMATLNHGLQIAYYVIVGTVCAVWVAAK